MARSFFSVCMLLLVISCSDKKDDSLLTQAPYATLTDSIKIKGSDPELYYRRAVLLYQNNEKKAAEDDLKKAWKLMPKESYALSLSTLLRERSEDDAIKFLEIAASELPNSIAVRVGLARGYQKKEQFDKALDLCNQVIARYPAQLDALILKSEILDAQNKTPESLATLATAYSYAPSDVELVHNYAFALAEAKDPRALKISDSLILADSAGSHAEPYYFKGLYYENTGSASEALKLFDEAIRHDYYFLDAYMEKGQVFYNGKRYQEALKTFQLAVTITPSFADAYYWVGKSLEALGNKRDAKMNYQRAYGLDQSMKEAKDAAERL